jgi:hypothetical protein
MNTVQNDLSQWNNGFTTATSCKIVQNSTTVENKLLNSYINCKPQKCKNAAKIPTTPNIRFIPVSNAAILKYRYICPTQHMTIYWK